MDSLPGDLFLLERGERVGVFEPHAEASDDLVPWFESRVDPGPGHDAHLVGLPPCHDALVVLNTGQVGTAVVVLSLKTNKTLTSSIFCLDYYVQEEVMDSSACPDIRKMTITQLQRPKLIKKFCGLKSARLQQSVFLFIGSSENTLYKQT